MGFDDANQFCKDIGLEGLAEALSDEDTTTIAGLILCKFEK
jgi:hypothetical protein